EIEPLGGGKKGEVVVEVVRAIHRTGRAHVGAQLEGLDQILAAIEKATAGGTQQPLLGPTGEKVDVAGLHVNREGAESLNGVHHQVHPALPAERAHGGNVVAEAGGEHGGADRDHAGP